MSIPVSDRSLEYVSELDIWTTNTVDQCNHGKNYESDDHRVVVERVVGGLKYDEIILKRKWIVLVNLKRLGIK